MSTGVTASKQKWSATEDHKYSSGGRRHSLAPPLRFTEKKHFLHQGGVRRPPRIVFFFFPILCNPSPCLLFVEQIKSSASLERHPPRKKKTNKNSWRTGKKKAVHEPEHLKIMSETKVVAGERNKVVAAVASSNGRHKSFQKEVLNPSFFFSRIWV